MTKEKQVEAQKTEEPQLKGVIPPTLSPEEGRELIEWLRENQKNIPYFLVKEHRKRVREISKPPDRFRRD
jgi:hypothetical protein